MEVVWGVAVMLVLGAAKLLFSQVLGEVIGVLLSPLTKPAGRVLSPVWNAYVGALTRSRLAVLWILCLAGAGYLLPALDTTAGAAQAAGILAFIALPTLAMISTITYRHHEHGPRSASALRR